MHAVYLDDIMPDMLFDICRFEGEICVINLYNCTSPEAPKRSSGLFLIIYQTRSLLIQAF